MNALDDMISLLDEEYQSILDINFENLSKILLRKEKIEGRLSDLKYQEHGFDAEKVLKAVRRNAEALAASMRGIEAARREIQDIREGLNQAIYGQDGKRNTLLTSNKNIEHRI